MVTTKQVREKLHTDTVSRKGDVFTVRVGFFYRMGKDVSNLENAVKKAFPNAVIVDSGEKWVAFRGGHTTAQGSHWWVKFQVPEETSEQHDTQSETPASTVA